MIRRAPALAAALMIAAFTLTGCGGDDAPKGTASPSASTMTPSPSATSASPTPTKSATPSETPTSEPTPEPTETAAVAEAAPTQAPAGDDEVQRFFQTGGQCISDVWSSSMPHTDALQQKVIDYCSANQLGDWAHGVDPMDPKNYGGGQSGPAEKSAATQDEEIAKCQALDINTAMSGDIQYCYNEYGISVGNPPATPDVAGPSAP